MARRKPFMCSWCKDIPRVERGGTITLIHFREDNEVFEGQAALDWIARQCACKQVVVEEVPEIRRPGARILKPGTNVYVQLKRKPGTSRDEGFVTNCYENGTVRIQLLTDKHAVVTVPADEYVIGRRGTRADETRAS